MRSPATWGLAPEGRSAASRLTALALFGHAAAFYAGPEPKMTETLAALAAAYDKVVTPEPSLGETRSGGWLGDDAFLATIERFFAAPQQAPAPGWESSAAAAARFAAAVQRLCALHGPVVTPGHALPGTFAVASGGRALVSYLAHVLGYQPTRAFETWRALRMPDIAVVDLPAGGPPRLTIPFGALRV